MQVQVDAKNSMFRADLCREAAFSAFLDTCLYTPLEQLLQRSSHHSSPPQFERVFDYHLQRAGVDIILNEGQWVTFIDEKAQLHNMNEDIQTFAFELSYLRDGIVEAGWLLDPQKKTDAYMLCWPFGETIDGKDVYCAAKILLVPKTRILAAIAHYGYDRQEIAIRDTCLRERGMAGAYKTKCPYFHFYYSDKYVEQMINLVVRRPLLEAIAIASLTASLAPDKKAVQMTGHWLGCEIDSAVPICDTAQ